MRFKKIVFTLCLLGFSIGMVQAQDSLLIKKVYRLMEVTGASKNFEVVMDQMIDIQKGNYSTDFQEEYWEKFRSQIKGEGFDELLEQITPIYLKHMTEEELDGMIAFYESEIGQKVVQKTPLIQQESMQIGAKWGEAFGKKIIKQIEDSDDYKFNQTYTGCGKFKEGKFISILPNGEKVEIERKGNIQIEKTEDSVFRFHLEWESECRYKIWEIDENNEPTEEEPLEINIYEFDKNSYRYISKMEGVDFYAKGEIKKPIKQM